MRSLNPILPSRSKVRTRLRDPIPAAASQSRAIVLRLSRRDGERGGRRGHAGWRATSTVFVDDGRGLDNVAEFWHDRRLLVMLDSVLDIAVVRLSGMLLGTAQLYGVRARLKACHAGWLRVSKSPVVLRAAEITAPRVCVELGYVRDDFLGL